MHRSEGRNAPVWRGLHKAVVMTLFGSMIWLVTAYWLAFSRSDYATLQLAMVVFFGVIYAGIPFAMSRMAPKPEIQEKQPGYRNWAQGDLDTFTGPAKAGDSAITVLVAPVAIAVGGSAIALVAALAGRGLL